MSEAPRTWLARARAHPRPVVVDVWAPWCGPCRALAPGLDRVAARYEGRVDLWKVNADDAPDLVRALGVRGIPTLIVIREGRELARDVGFLDEAALEELFALAGAGSPPAAVPRRPVHDAGASRELAFRLVTAAALLAIGMAAGGQPVPLAAGAVVALAAVYDRWLRRPLAGAPR
jgi:thioredoxin 1